MSDSDENKMKRARLEAGEGADGGDMHVSFASKAEEEEAKRFVTSNNHFLIANAILILPLRICNRIMEIAARAERRALERQQRDKEVDNSKHHSDSFTNTSGSSSGNNNATSVPIVETTKFLTKQQRAQLALDRLQNKREEEAKKIKEASEAHNRFITGQAIEERKQKERLEKLKEDENKRRRELEENKGTKEQDYELKAIREHYFGGGPLKKKILKPTEKFAKLFQFDWDAEEDTGRHDMNPLYCNRVKINALFGRGYIAGIDQREQRKESNYLLALSERRLREDGESSSSGPNQAATDALRNRHMQELVMLEQSEKRDLMGSHWSEKSLEAMTDRDWRIFREDFDIRIQGGRATLPIRYWHEAKFPTSVMRAIEDLGYEKPSPIQRQAIPIGRAFRDIIGIAETGSGKTAAFMIPLLCYLLCNVPDEFINRCADEGPLAVIMAPTRELAQQIEEECVKLCKYTNFKSTCIVGGQSIEDQGFTLRRGVHIVIGTPGRLCDCLQNNYLVLNQCNYVVLDEADRMIDMGFEPQVVEVLDSMGGLLKSEDEDQAMQEAQLSSSNNGSMGRTLYRVTAMFSATMMPEVERIAKKYLRHPIILKIGDSGSGKNKRIEQRVSFISEGQKKSKLLQDLQQLSTSDKSIIFINSKKQGDLVGRFLEAANYRIGILHGGKSQEQREVTLELFRRSDCQHLVATDVAGRGLDISDVTYVFNYDVPNKIDNYCHRIGRTGRAGKSGIAISYITDADTDIMYDLKAYLDSTGAVVPHDLRSHPSATAKSGERDDKGNLLGQKRDSVKYLK